MLVDLVLSEELDVWDLDIAQIAQRFLEEVRAMASLNLRLSGKTLLASAFLLRLKSDNLLPAEEAPEEGELLFDFLFQEEETEGGGEGIILLEPPMRRRAERKATLFELVAALQRALSEEMIRRNFPREPREVQKLVIPVDEESIKERVARLYERIRKMAQGQDAVRFTDLLSHRRREEIVEVLLSLLYLDSQRRITIWQEELFGEIFITLR
jgi:segregation and condensation protein A